MKVIRSIWRRIGEWAMTVKKQPKYLSDGLTIKLRSTHDHSFAVSSSTPKRSRRSFLVAIPSRQEILETEMQSIAEDYLDCKAFDEAPSTKESFLKAESIVQRAIERAKQLPKRSAAEVRADFNATWDRVSRF